MLFNSISFLLFFVVILTLYWALPHKYRNALLLVGSYYFYMCWSPFYSILIIITTLTTWGGAILIDKHGKKTAKAFLALTILINLSILFTFKYYDFVCSVFEGFLSLFGCTIHHRSLGWMLPVGISFYTFQSIGYIVDVYKNKISPERNLFIYALFISFFPQLVAGPIERSSNLLPQFRIEKKFVFEAFKYGFMLILWGLFLKLCLGDRCGIYVDAIYNNLEQHNGGSYLLASFLFSFQIYGDFCGYSLIAIGTAKMLGFNMMNNFNSPYLSTSISDFWRRWHISLSSWFKDYVYIPLGGSHVSKLRNYGNLMITMLLSGLWHGASTHFVVWGALNGLAMCLERMFGIGKIKSKGIILILRTIVTFALVSFLWIFFRSKTMCDATNVISGIFTNPDIPFCYFTHFVAIVVALLVVMTYEIMRERGVHLSSISNKRVKAVVEYVYCIGIICYILLFGVLNGDQFIYFQF